VNNIHATIRSPESCYLSNFDQTTRYLLGILQRTFQRRRPWQNKQPTILDGLTARIIFSSVKEGVHLTNEEKQNRIRPWINPEERVTVHFLDAPDLNTTVTGCTDQSVDLSIETQVAHLKQKISVPLSQVEVTEDFSHYTRDPERPLQQQRLMLVINEKRPPIIY
jgi:hypothetical protein